MDFKFYNRTVCNNFLLTIQMKDCIKFICTEFSNRKDKYLNNRDFPVSIGKSISLTTSKLLNLLITMDSVSSIFLINGVQQLLPMNHLSSLNLDLTIKNIKIFLNPTLIFLRLSSKSNILPNKSIILLSVSDRKTKIFSEIK